MPICQLAPDVAAKIAAGEVVERPASVVKELIENSIDARATQIRVDLTNGGLQLIRVTDNGGGIPADELSLALSRHATSKVARIDDLEHIRSLGFRGEALASIAAVADVTLLSRARGAEQAAQISAQNGQISEVSAAASPEGTTLTVRNLFSAVPARLKFLKSRNTEVSHCHHLLEQYALAYPEIRFSVFSEGRQIFATPGDGQLSSVLVEIYGLQVAEQMVPISSLDGHDDDAERPVVTGYTSLPACYKSTRQHMSFFVNRRWVMSRMLSYAVEEAYHSLLLAGRHPIAVVNIALDPSQIDVNVHPAKTEIRFLKERRVYAAVLRAVRRAVLEEAQMPKWGGSAGRSSQDEAGVRARRMTETDAIKGVPTESEDVGTPFTSSPSDAIGMPFMMSPSGSVGTPIMASAHDEEIPSLPPDNPWLTVTEEETGTRPPLLSRLWQSHVHGRDDAGKNGTGTPQIGGPAAEHLSIAPDEAATENSPAQAATNGASTFNPFSAPPEGTSWHEAADKPIKPTMDTPTQPSLPIQQGRLPELRVLGQLAQSYIVTEGKEGMYLIDQHAAHERILLERMIASLQARAPLSQLLLTPLSLELAPNELGAIEDHAQQLEHIGFALEIQENAVLVRAVPNVLMKQLNALSLQDLLAELTAPENLGHAETWEEHALANVACKAALKANYFLTVSEMREMIEQLGRTKAPYSCCHGRPTMIHFDMSALEREFGRR